MVLKEVTEEGTLMDSSTPQAKAYLWMLNDDPAQVDPCSYSKILQRYILATLYFSSGGEEWNAANGWLTGEAECNWLGITCGGSDAVTGIELRTSCLNFITKKSKILSLDLSNTFAF